MVALIVGAALATAGAGRGLAASVPAQGSAHGTTATTPVRCKKRTEAHGTILYSDWQFPDTLNPYQGSAQVDAETTDGMFSPLVSYNARSRLYPVMLTRLPSPQYHDILDGGKTIVLHLKKGMLWSTGAEITSADARFGWEIMMDRATGPRCSGTCDIIKRFDTPNRYTFVLHLKRPYALAVPNALPDLWPHHLPGVWSDAHAAALKLAQDSKFNFEGPDYPTNGPYQVESFVHNDRIVLHPMKHYNVMNCGAAVAHLIFAFYASKPGMMAAAASRETDVTQNYTPADLPELSTHSASYRVYSVPAYNYEHLELNVDPTWKDRPNPLHNVNVRLALALAIDRIGLTQSALGISASEARSIVAWTPWINSPHLVLPSTDRSIDGQWDPMQKRYVTPGRGKALEDARKLLARTRWKGGFTVEFATTSGNPTRAAEESVVAAGWLKIGVHTSPDFIPSTIFFADYGKGGTLHRGDFQVCLFTSTLSPTFEDIKYRLQSKYIDREAAVKSTINYNYSGIKDRIFDRDLNLAVATYNKKLEKRYYSAVQVELNKQAYWVPFYFRPFISTADGKVKGYDPSPLSAGWNKYAWTASSS